MPEIPKVPPSARPRLRVTAALAAAMLRHGRGGRRGDRPRAILLPGQPRACRCCSSRWHEVLRAPPRPGRAQRQPPAITAEATPSRDNDAGASASTRSDERSRRAPTSLRLGNGNDDADIHHDDVDGAKASRSDAPADHARVADRADGHVVRAAPSAQAGAAPYIDSQLDPRGDAAERLVGARGRRICERDGAAGGRPPPQTLDSIVQPPCPEGAAGAACTRETAGELTAADEFLKATVPSITSSAPTANTA